MAEGSVSRKRKRDDEFVRPKAAWSDLSTTAFRKIYRFLDSREDKINMALACDSWYEKHSYGLDYFNCKITLKMLEEKDYKMTEKYVKKFAHLFEMVRIEFPNTNETRLLLPWVKHLAEVTRIIKRKREHLYGLCLEKVNIGSAEESKGSGRIKVVEGDEVEAGAVEAAENEENEITLYASTQTSITLFLNYFYIELLSLAHLEFDYFDCISILGFAMQNNPLHNLSMQGFVKHEDDAGFLRWGTAPEWQTLRTILPKKSLEVLQIDHRLILGKDANPTEVIEILAQQQRPLKLHIWTVVNSSSNNFKTFTSDHWDILKGNSNLEVKIGLYSESKYKSEMERIFLPGAPITKITHIFNKNENFGINDLFRYLNSRNPTEYINQMNLEFKESVTDLVSTLKPCLERCKNLNLLTLIFVHPVEDLKLFLGELVSVLPNRLKFKVAITRINSESELSRLQNVASDFKNRFKSVNIHFDMLFQKM